ncbi:sensor histidine kinase [Pseudobacteroides cellulosolvens]|uniref:sensor histidine kinase n=1 Tax=Pseudobacteroides cellulosolvens TaxID=35825 RepID=UPI0013649D75|nr:sensor histidine kinase [Pseudobacteroides cellulosolvens]
MEYKEKLAIANERNRISRELHDTLGHTLTLLVTLIKSSRINIKKDPEETENKLIQAADIASEGLKQIRTSISGWLPEKLNSGQITYEIRKLIEFAKDTGIDIDFSVYGKERINAPVYSEVLYKICREAITNSLRHGKATKIIVILKFKQKEIQLFVNDDGIGCRNIKKGFGLIGLEERVKDINGTLSYGTSGNRGFNIHAKIPNKVIS